MKKLIITIMILASAQAFALDPNKPVAQKIGDEIRLVKSKLPNTWKGISNYRKAGDTQWTADNWVQVESSIVVTTNIIDRAEVNLVVDELTGQTNSVPVDANYLGDVAKVAQGANALEVIDPLTDGKVALKAFQKLPQSAITANAKEKFNAGNASKKDEINSARIELINIILEALAEGKDWRDIDDSQFVTNIVTSTVWTEVVE